MEFTGERVIPGQVNADLWAEHFSRYAFASVIAKSAGATSSAAPARVLDIGCGSGYGTAHLAQHAQAVTGIDFSHEAIAHCRSHYTGRNLTFTQASATDLPLPAETFDLITAFEVIEHIERWPDMLKEAKRVLKPNGIFLVSTPNTDYYAESRAESGPNPYHVHEFTYAEFRQALLERFQTVIIFLQNPAIGFTFTPSESAESGANGYIENPLGDPENAYFYLAVCTPQNLPDTTPYIYVPSASNVLRDREHHIHSLQKELAEIHQQHRDLANSHTELEVHLTKQNTWAKTLDAELSLARTQIADVQNHLEQQNKWALGLDRELNEAREYLGRLQIDFEERTKWALSLNEQLQIERDRLAAAHAQLAYVSASRWHRLGRKLGLGPKLNSSE